MYSFNINLPGYDGPFIVSIPLEVYHGVVAACEARDWGTVCPLVNVDNSVYWRIDTGGLSFGAHTPHYHKLIDAAVREYIHGVWLRLTP